MDYRDHFKLADDLIAHLDTAVAAVTDPFVRTRYAGFLAVSTVTVLELGVRTIFEEFAGRKHKVFRTFVGGSFARINGRIRLDDMRDYAMRFGDRYKRALSDHVEMLEKTTLAQSGKSVSTCYGNLLTWRNEFAHEGRVPTNATYEEVKAAYECGKLVLDCLDRSMKR